MQNVYQSYIMFLESTSRDVILRWKDFKRNTGFHFTNNLLLFFGNEKMLYMS